MSKHLPACLRPREFDGNKQEASELLAILAQVRGGGGGGGRDRHPLLHPPGPLGASVPNRPTVL